MFRRLLLRQLLNRIPKGSTLWVLDAETRNGAKIAFGPFVSKIEVLEEAVEHRDCVKLYARKMLVP